VLFAVIVGVSMLFLVAWAYITFGHPSVFCDAGLSLFCLGEFVMRIFAVVWDEEMLARMI
jgi:hypothetical protein